MRKLLFVIIGCLASKFAFSTILDQNSMNFLVDSIGKDEFISAINKNSQICYDAYGYPTIYDVNHLPNFTTDISAYSTLSYNQNQSSTSASYDPSSVKYSYDSTGSQRSISYLSNPYNEGGENHDQTLRTSSYTYNSTESVSTTTTFGWELDFTEVFNIDIPFVMDGAETTLHGEVSGSTSTTITTSNSYSYTAPATAFFVPVGCTAVVEQSLHLGTSSGSYTFSDTLDNAVIAFTTVTNGSDTRSGYVKLSDLISNGDIPQNNFSVNSQGQVEVLGSGYFSAIDSSIYSVTYHYEEAQAQAHCKQPSNQEQERILSAAGAYDVHWDKKGNASFKIKPVLLKVLDHKVMVAENQS